MMKLVVAALVVAFAAGCDQCLLRPCGVCYDSVISASMREPTPLPKPLPKPDVAPQLPSTMPASSSMPR